MIKSMKSTSKKKRVTITNYIFDDGTISNVTEIDGFEKLELIGLFESLKFVILNREIDKSKFEIYHTKDITTINLKNKENAFYKKGEQAPIGVELVPKYEQNKKNIIPEKQQIGEWDATDLMIISSQIEVFLLKKDTNTISVFNTHLKIKVANNISFKYIQKCHRGCVELFLKCMCTSGGDSPLKIDLNKKNIFFKSLTLEILTY